MTELLELPGPLPAEWAALDADGNAFFNDQIAKEGPKEHPLWRQPFRSVARSVVTDDVIIELSPKVRGRWAIVHVTYAASIDPRGPGCVIFDNWEQCSAAAHRMAAEWRGEPTKFVLTIDGNRFDDFDGFAGAFSSLLADWSWNKNLDALNDILRGGFGTPDGGFVLRWTNSARSREALGWAETVAYVERKLDTSHPTNRQRMREDLEAARRREGQTLFELIVEIVCEHGPGGSEAGSGVELELR